jgi:hypothetical protein
VELTENNFRHHPLRGLAMKKTTVRERTQTGRPRCGPEYVDKLLQLAAKAQRLALQISNESEVCRLAGRLCRLVQFSYSEFTEREVEAFAAARIFQIEDGNCSAPLKTRQSGSPNLVQLRNSKTPLAEFDFLPRDADGRDCTPESSDRSTPALPARCDIPPSRLPLPLGCDGIVRCSCCPPGDDRRCGDG